MTRPTRLGCLLLFLLVELVCQPPAAQAQLGKWFVPAARVDADPHADYPLTETNGPWLIMAATFSGDGAEQQARSLLLEFRQAYNLPSYLHKMAFDFSADSPNRSLEGYGAPVRRRYRREEEDQFAVLVGDFPSIDDPDAQELLERVKKMRPKALEIQEGGKTAQSLVQVRAFFLMAEKKLRGDTNEPSGPMRQAFLARNPLLPRDYFVPKGVDKLVAKMNQGVKHSLLDCPGKYTVQVATFRGRTILLTNATESPASALPWRRSKDQDDALAEAAENAHLLTEELRAHGWEAYEFHDRTESFVTIGSFDQGVRVLPDGRQLTDPAVQRIVETFSAAYDTPSDPLIGDDARTQRVVDQREQELNRTLQSQRAPVMAGLNPKHVKIFKDRRRKGDVERFIPFDIYPKIIEAPKRSISSAYAR